MSRAVLVIGEPGAGKSSAIRTLDPAETYIISVLNKPLPFRNKYFKTIPKTETTPAVPGNHYVTDKANSIISCMKHINNNRPDIKNLVIDDWQYILSNHYMSRASETGYGKFSEIGRDGWGTILGATNSRDDLYCFVLAHSDRDIDGVSRLKTIGKMLNSTVSLDGMFTMVLHALVIDQEYKLLTQNDGTHIAKTPMGMFKDKYVDNDFQMVKNTIEEYYK